MKSFKKLNKVYCTSYKLESGAQDVQRADEYVEQTQQKNKLHDGPKNAQNFPLRVELCGTNTDKERDAREFSSCSAVRSCCSSYLTTLTRCPGARAGPTGQTPAPALIFLILNRIRIPFRPHLCPLALRLWE